MLRLKVGTCRINRMAFRLIPSVVRALVPGQLIGAYVLTVGPRPVYVGRSDRCLRTRLIGHSLIETATHFFVIPCSCEEEAYRWESALFHWLKNKGASLNQIHPARPASLIVRCPFCGHRDAGGLAVALSGCRDTASHNHLARGAQACS